MTIAPTPAQAKQSLFHLAADAQYIDGEIGIAAELLESDDPLDRDSAADLIEQLLLAQGHAKDRFLAKADNVCAYLQNLRAQADYRANEAKRLKALADADAAQGQDPRGLLDRRLADGHSRPDQVLAAGIRGALTRHRIGRAD